MDDMNKARSCLRSSMILLVWSIIFWAIMGYLIWRAL